MPKVMKGSQKTAAAERCLRFKCVLSSQCGAATIGAPTVTFERNPSGVVARPVLECTHATAPGLSTCGIASTHAFIADDEAAADYSVPAEGVPERAPSPPFD